MVYGMVTRLDYIMEMKKRNVRTLCKHLDVKGNNDCIQTPSFTISGDILKGPPELTQESIV